MGKAVIFESNMEFLFGMQNGRTLFPGDNEIPEAEAKKLLELSDTKERVKQGLIIVKSASDEKPKKEKVEESPQEDEG